MIYNNERRVLSGGDQLTKERQIGAQMHTGLYTEILPRGGQFGVWKKEGGQTFVHASHAI